MLGRTEPYYQPPIKNLAAPDLMIEVVGPPDSGKTTLIQKLAQNSSSWTTGYHLIVSTHEPSVGSTYASARKAALNYSLRNAWSTKTACVVLSERGPNHGLCMEFVHRTGDSKTFLAQSALINAVIFTDVSLGGARSRRIVAGKQPESSMVNSAVWSILSSSFKQWLIGYYPFLLESFGMGLLFLPEQVPIEEKTNLAVKYLTDVLERRKEAVFRKLTSPIFSNLAWRRG